MVKMLLSGIKPDRSILFYAFFGLSFKKKRQQSRIEGKMMAQRIPC